MPAAVAVPKAVIQGDLKNLTEQERTQYYQDVCQSLGLNPLTRPFEYITLNGKLTLYGKKDCTDQLRKIHRVSITELNSAIIEGIVVYTAQAKDGGGRTDIATGAAAIEGLKGENRANAIMKAETKAKRRVTLSLCGLGMLDETEVEPETAVFATAFTPIDSQPAPEPSSFIPVNEAPATEHTDAERPFQRALSPAAKPSPQEMEKIKSKVAKIRSILEDAGLQPSAGATTGTKLVRWFTKFSGSAPREMSLAQWTDSFAALETLLETNVKDAVKTIEEKIAE